MKPVIVGIADCQISMDPEAVLVTYALGSCIAVTIYDAAVRVAGLLHFMLPESCIDPAKAREKPFTFADTGIPLLFRKAYECGVDKRRMTVRVAGGAQVAPDGNLFDVGRRNYLAMRRILWKAGVLIHSEAVGGDLSRTVRLEVSSGTMWLKSGGAPEQELPAPSAARKGGNHGISGLDR